MNSTTGSGCRYPSRREFLALGLGAFVVSAMPWAARRERITRRTLPVMGTLAEIAVVHHDAAHAQAAMDAAFAELRSVERTMTRFRLDSDVGRANLAATGEAVAVTAATAEVLREALRWADASGGRFDPALGRAIAYWDVGHRTSPPATSELKRFAGQGLYRFIEVGESRGETVVVIRERDAGIDLGGIAKGFGVDRAVSALRDWGIRHALVNAGGDLFALGRSPEGDPWEVGVRSPRDAGRLAATLRLEDAAVATSGDYNQYFEHGGHRYHHLLDPDTGAPRRTDVRSVTVQADTCIAADAGATAVFVCPPGEAAQVLSAARRGARVVHQV